MKNLKYVLAVILCTLTLLSFPTLLAFIMPSSLQFISTFLCFLWGALNSLVIWKRIWNYVTE